MDDDEVDRAQARLEALFPIHWLMENEAMRTRVGNLLVSTVHITGVLASDATDHYETMVFRCNDKGKVTDFHDLFCLRTNDEVVGHENGIEWAKSQPNSPSDTRD